MPEARSAHDVAVLLASLPFSCIAMCMTFWLLSLEGKEKELAKKKCDASDSLISVFFPLHWLLVSVVLR